MASDRAQATGVESMSSAKKTTVHPITLTSVLASRLGVWPSEGLIAYMVI